jgi:hypothetical protein
MFDAILYQRNGIALKIQHQTISSKFILSKSCLFIRLAAKMIFKPMKGFEVNSSGCPFITMPIPTPQLREACD